MCNKPAEVSTVGVEQVRKEEREETRIISPSKMGWDLPESSLSKIALIPKIFHDS